MVDRNRNHAFLWKQLLDAPAPRLSTYPCEQLFADWNMLVQYYGSRDLTVPNDKLVALSGLANNMKARLQQLRPGPHRYLAGLWEEKLMDTLVWNVEAPARRAVQYRAPSWSWACLDGELSFNGCDHGKMIYFTSMISVEMTHPGKEDTGEVDGGTLTLAGPCVLAKVDGRNWLWDKNVRPVRSMQGEDGSYLYEEYEAEFMANIHFDTLNDLTEEALLLWVCAHPASRYHRAWRGYGLVLARVEEDKHRRLGMVSCNFSYKDDARAFTAGFPQKQIRII